MAGHLTTEAREGYRQRTLSPAELFAVDDHLAACEPCRRQVAEAPELQETFAAFREGLEGLKGVEGAGEEPFHLAEEQLTAYLAGSLDEVDREIAEGHLETCSRCAAEARELRAFHAMLSTHPVRTYAPEAPPGFWERLRRTARGSALLLPVGALGTAAASAAVLFFVVVRPLRTDLASERSRAAELARQNAALQQRTASSQDLEGEVARLRREAEAARTEAARAREQNTALARRNEELARRTPAGDPGRPLPGIPGASAPAPLALNDGAGRLARDAGGSLVRTERLPEPVARAVRDGQVAKPMVLAMLIDGPVILRGADGGGTLAARGPLGTVVRGDRPTFTWTPLPGANRYRVSLYDADLEQVAQSGPVTGTEWTPDRPLPRGKVLQWEVTAYRDDEELDRAPRPPAPAAKFQVLDARRAAELLRAEQTYAGSHLTLGVLYAEAGLLDEAERELRSLLKANPGSETAKRLLHSVEALRAGGGR